MSKKAKIVVGTILILAIICMAVIYSNRTNIEYLKYLCVSAKKYKQMTPEEQLEIKIKKFEWLVKRKKFADLTLTIYHNKPYLGGDYGAGIFYKNVDMLIEIVNELYSPDMEKYPQYYPGIGYTYYVTVDGNKLFSNIDALKKLNYNEISFVDAGNRLAAGVYYVFKYKDEPLIEVAMWGVEKNVDRLSTDENNWTIFVNNVEVENRKVFYDAILPFMKQETTDYFIYISENCTK